METALLAQLVGRLNTQPGGRGVRVTFGDVVGIGYVLSKVSTHNNSTVRGPQLQDINSLERGGGGGGDVVILV